jgi:hypothetical protein
MKKRGRPRKLETLAKAVFELVEGKMATGRFKSHRAAMRWLAEPDSIPSVANLNLKAVPFPGGALSGAGPMKQWRTLATAGKAPMGTLKRWQNLYTIGRELSGLPPLPTGRKR